MKLLIVFALALFFHAVAAENGASEKILISVPQRDIEQLIDAVAHGTRLPEWYTEWLSETGQTSAYSVDAHCKPQDMVIAERDSRERVVFLQSAKTELDDVLAQQARFPRIMFERMQSLQCQMKGYKDSEQLLRNRVRELETICANCTDTERAQFCQGQKKRCLYPCQFTSGVEELQRQLNDCRNGCLPYAMNDNREQPLAERRLADQACQEGCDSGPGRALEAWRSGQCTSMWCLEQHNKCLRGEDMLFF